MEGVQVANEGTSMNDVQKFYFYEETYKTNEMNKKWTLRSNKIFKTLDRQKHAREHHAHPTAIPSSSTY
jgi:hypothetical protein